MWDRRFVLLVVALIARLGAQAPTTRLEGLVLDPLSQPVANARITVEVDGEVVAQTQTDALGTFVVGKAPAQKVVVRATTAVPDVGATAVDLFAEPRGFALLHMMPARQVAGTVRDDAGKVIVGAWVVCSPRGDVLAPGWREAGFAGSHTQSDAEGHYLLTHVPFGRVALRAWAAGLAGFAAEVGGTANATVDCTLPRGELQRRSFEIVGATPVQIAAAQIHVSVWADGAELILPPALRETALDVTGSRKVLGWPLADEMRARIELAATFLYPVESSVSADAPNLINQSFRFGSDEVAFVHGRVVGDGVPVAGVQLLAEGFTPGNRAPPRTSGTTTRDGTFALTAPVARGDVFQLRCKDPEFVLRRKTPAQSITTSLRTFAIQVHTPDVGHELVLRRAHTVRCTLRDADGAPVAGAAIALLGPPQFRHLMGCADVFAQYHSSVDGTVELRGLELHEGERIVCEAHGPRGIVEHEFLVTEDLVQDLGALQVGPGATLTVKARTAAGKPIAGARLAITNTGRSQDGYFLPTDREGDCRLVGLMPGLCEVRIVGEPESAQTFRVAKGAAREVLVQSAQ